MLIDDILLNRNFYLLPSIHRIDFIYLAKNNLISSLLYCHNYKIINHILTHKSKYRKYIQLMDFFFHKRNYLEHKYFLRQKYLFNLSDLYNLDLLKMIEDYKIYPTKNNYGKKLLQIACDDNNKEVVKILFDCGMYPDDGYDSCKPSLFNRMVYSNNLEMIKLFIEYDIEMEKIYIFDIRKFQSAEVHLIHYVCYYDNISLMKYLIDIGVNLESEDEYGNKPIYYAYISGNLEIVQLLIDGFISNELSRNPPKVKIDLASLIEIESEWQEIFALYDMPGKNEINNFLAFKEKIQNSTLFNKRITSFTDISLI